MNIQKPALDVILIGIILLLPACWPLSSKKNEQPDLIVLNVLDKPMYDDCHIKNSIHVSLDELEQFSAPLNKDKVEIVVYCSNYMCTTSEWVAKKLMALGFKHVWAYEGGMAEWYQLGLPIEGSAQGSYLTKANEKPVIENHDVNVITAQELDEKIKKMTATQMAA